MRRRVRTDRTSDDEAVTSRTRGNRCVSKYLLARLEGRRYVAPMISRERILYAAARVYAQHGFRGATTRLIAQEAGVNEVTLFRIFGSKSALLKEVVEQSSINTLCPALPSEPVDPEKELTAWTSAYFGGLTARRSMVRTTMGEIEERPDVGFCIAQGPMAANKALRDYVRALQKAGLADAAIDPVTPCAM